MNPCILIRKLNEIENEELLREMHVIISHKDNRRLKLLKELTSENLKKFNQENDSDYKGIPLFGNMNDLYNSNRPFTAKTSKV